MKNKRSLTHISIIFAILAALFYGISAPFAKVLLEEISPYFLSSLLYFGAGIGMMIVILVKKKSKNLNTSFKKTDLVYIVSMIILDIIAPILLLVGLGMTQASTTSLLNNFEIVFTSLIAMIFFKEIIGRRMWIAIILIFIAGVILSIEDIETFSISTGSIFVILASLAWGLENNCTRMLSLRDPLKVVVIKGIGSGVGALIIAIILNAVNLNLLYILSALVLGFIAYGLSLFFYISAQRHLGAARTSAYYATAPFIGSLISIIFLKENSTIYFLVAFIIMIIGSILAIRENTFKKKIH